MSDLQMARAIQIWPLTRLKPFDKNPRTHSEEQITELAGLIVQFGFTAPILVDENAGILEGHGRLLAAKRLGLTEVPVVELTHMTEAQKRAYIVAANKIAEKAGWDRALVAEAYRAVEEAGLDPTITGFAPEEIEALEMALQGASELPGMDEGDLDRPRGLGNPVISYVIVFDDEDQQALWFDFLRWLKRQGGAGQTIAGRLTAVIAAVMAGGPP